uniref:Uncharacterized protein n=1 Tax=Paracidobacterium acidisoli TaxID=2303751 RepID=A0A372ISW2_9BACT
MLYGRRLAFRREDGAAETGQILDFLLEQIVIDWVVFSDGGQRECFAAFNRMGEKAKKHFKSACERDYRCNPHPRRAQFNSAEHMKTA